MAAIARGFCFSPDLSTLHRRSPRLHAAAAALPVHDSAFLFSSSSSRAIGSSSMAPVPASPVPPLASFPSTCRWPEEVFPSREGFCRLVVECSGNGDGGVGKSGGGAGGGGGGGGGGGHGGEEGSGGEEESIRRNRMEALLALSQAERSLESLPKDLAAAIEGGRVPGSIVERFFELEKSPLLRWLLQFGGFKERLLADDLFLAKVMMECGVGIFTKTAAEWERRRENFMKELDFVFADVAMAIVADFMLVWLPAPTVSLRPSLSFSAGPISKFFHGCPDNAFQASCLGRIILFSFAESGRNSGKRNGAKLFVVGTASSLIGTGIINTLNNAKRAMDRDFTEEVEDVPILSTSAAYGVYMAVSSNLRYQLLAGVIEQRILEPLLHNHKVALGALCFAFRTGNTFLGSLLWVDYARWVGVQQIKE
ncbi:hypothetical protein Taro_007178 [Colocasia esculenta]|uniref:Protein RETICULATA-RELATED 4, chloroplastic n=1 Tax=Colocasia esculenta TaxID=4460 RepID=A0A843TUS4_COLES|nr:hypothetical protein [Colocasia esculenta]